MEEERLLESKRAAEARAAKYKPSRPLPNDQKGSVPLKYKSY